MDYYQPTSFGQKIQKVFRLYKILFLKDLSPATPVTQKCFALMMVVPSVDRVGGYERQALELSQSLTETGNLVSIVSHPAGSFPKREFRNGFLVHRLEGSGITLFFRLALFLFAKRKRFDMLHAHGVTGFSLIAARLAALLGRPVCLKPATRDDLNTIVSKSSLKHRFYKRWLKRIDHWIVISRELKEELASCNVPESKIHCVPNFVNSVKFTKASPERREVLRKRFSIPSNQVVFLFLGRLEKRKGVDYLLEAWRMDPCGILWIVGSGSEEERLKKQAESQGLPNIQFHGSTLKPLDYYQAANVFVLPSIKEGFPNVLLEAMSCGLPCIATEIGGVVDLLQQDQQGLLVETAAIEPLSKALRRAADSRADRMRWSMSAMQTVRDKYDRSQVTAQYLQLYSQWLR
ncbi:glycosyltransferase family 4 protein [bacterium]|nr:glycosyltransferase family 4 protein [bacterium]MCI0604725.1 glycosyltransferase family 4 protein [bacterium]